MNESNERVLLAEAAAGSETALRQILKRHGGRVHACALRFCGDAEAAEEITQDVFVRLVRQAADFRFESSLATWLYRVTINRCHDRRRRNARQPRTVSLQLEGVQRMAAEPRADEGMEAAERKSVLEQALAALPAALRDVVVLRFVGGLAYQEIAEVLSVPAGSVASRLHRALQHLGQLLEERGLNAESLL